MTTQLAGKLRRLPRQGLHSVRISPWLLCHALMVEVALQFLLKTWSEVLEILMFAAILTAFLAAKFAAEGPRGWWGILTGTWTQRLAALFILGVMISFLWGDHSTRSVLALFRLPTYLVIIAMVVETLRQEGRIPSFAWTILGGIALVFVLVLFEFYFGSDWVGLQCADVAKCTANKITGWHWEGLLHSATDAGAFADAGGNLNASVIAEAYGISRLALFALLAYGLGLGLILTSKRMSARLVAGGLLAIIVFGIFSSGSRSGALALPIVLAAGIALSAVSLRRVVVQLTAAGIAVLAAAFLMLQVLPTGATSFDRVFTESIDWSFGFGKEKEIDEPPPPRVKIGVAGIRYEEAAKRIGEPLNAYLVHDWLYRADDGDDVRGWRWQRANAQSDDANAPDNSTWTEIDGAWLYEYATTGDDRGKFLRSYVYYEKHGETYWAQTPAIGPIGEASAGIVTPPTAEVDLSPDEQRTRNWQLALALFADAPAGGSGFRTFQPEVRRNFPNARVVGVHNGYLKVLSESGLLGALPMLAVLAWAGWQMLRLAPGAPAAAILWRNAFLSAFVAFLALNLVDTHSEDRFFWTALAFAAVVEVWNRRRASEPEPRPDDQPAEPGPADAATERAGR